MTEDPRYLSLRAGLDQLTSDELSRLRDWLLSGDELALDDVNYNESTKTWCPLAVAVGLPGVFAGRQPDNARVTAMLALLGLRVNNTRNVPGKYYQGNRRSDLQAAVDDVFFSRVE